MKNISIKSNEKIALIAESGKYLTEILTKLYHSCSEGVTLLELEQIANSFMKNNNITGAFKGYEGFPANLCLSVNDCLVHGIPDEYVLMSGDLLKVDCGVMYKGAISDAAFSIVIGGGDSNKEGDELIRSTKYALDTSIKTLGPGVTANTFARAMKKSLQERDISVIKNLTGHGVGDSVHESPHVYNRPHGSMKKWKFTSGMVIAIEPITAQRSESCIEKRGIPWNLYTAGGDLGAQREYTIAITDSGYTILAGISDDIFDG